MSLFDIAYKNIKRNFNDYLMYFISMIFSIMMYCTFVTIQYNDSIEKAVGASMKLGTIFKASSIVMIIFCSIFIWVSNSFFTRKRKKEMALYSLLGVKKRQIGSMFFYETLLMGVIALIVGTLLGAILSNLFTSILIKLMGFASISIPFKIIPRAMIQTCVVFLIIFFLTSLHSASLIYRYKLVDLFKGEESAESEPKSNILISIISVAMIGVGYSLVFGKFLSAFSVLATLVLTILGTYGLFSSSLVALIKFNKKNKVRYFKGLNMLSNSQLLYRIKGNSRTLATIAILSATTLTAVGFTYSLYYRNESMSRITYPYSLSFMSNDKNLESKVDETINSYYNNKPINKENVTFLKYNLSKNAKKPKEVYILSESDYARLIEPVGYTNKLSLSSEDDANSVFGSIDKDISPSYPKNKYLDIKVNDSNVKFNIVKDLPLNPLSFETAYEFYVVKDSAFKKIFNKDLAINCTNYKLNNDTSMKNLSDALDKIFLASLNDNKMTVDNFEFRIKANYSNFFYNYNATMQATGTMLFIGAFLGLVFLICTGSIIFFKQLSEATNNKGEYAILKKIGVNNKEMKRSISKQLLFIFTVPLIIAICHSTAAISAAANLFRMNLIIPALITFAVYGAIYMIYYFVTLNSYYKIVNSKE